MTTVNSGTCPPTSGTTNAGGLDGAWWPRTSNSERELHALVAHLGESRAGISRLSLSSNGWDSAPDHLRHDNRDVSLNWFRLRDPHTVTIGYAAEELTLLVVPPQAAATAAARAMSMASHRQNRRDPADILRANALTHPAPGRSAANTVHSTDLRLSLVTDPGPEAADQTSGAGRGPPASLRPPLTAHQPLPAYANEARSYDRRTQHFSTYRTLIVDVLPLSRGQTVLDVGCGTGLAFAALRAKVGPQGRIIGIDESPEMMSLARQHVTSEDWDNITLLQSPVTDAQIPSGADAAVFCAVHDILRSPQSLRRIVTSLRPGAWVAAGGGKWAAPLMVALNWQVRALHAPFVRNFEGFHRPWSHLEQLLQDVRVHEVALGRGFVMTGRTPTGDVRDAEGLT